MSAGDALPTVTLATTSAYCVDLFESVAADPTSCERWAVPMTTQFVIPDDCDPIIRQASTGVASSCRPDGFFQVWWNDGYYSPAVCPEGYNVACTATSGSVNYEEISPSQTVGMCVPRYVVPSLSNRGRRRRVMRLLRKALGQRKRVKRTSG